MIEEYLNLRLYQVGAYYIDSNGEEQYHSFITYGDEEKLLKELQEFYEINKGKRNIKGYNVDIWESTYPTSIGNEIIFYIVKKQLSLNSYEQSRTNLEKLLDKIKFQYHKHSRADLGALLDKIKKELLDEIRFKDYFYNSNLKELSESNYEHSHITLEKLLDEIKFEYYDCLDISFFALTLNQDGSVDIATDLLVEFLELECGMEQESYYINKDGIVVKKSNELVRTLI